MKTIISMTLALFVFVITSCTSNDYGKTDNAQELQTNISCVSTLEDLNASLLEVNKKYEVFPNGRASTALDHEVAACDALGAMCAIENSYTMICFPQLVAGSIIGCAAIASATCMIWGNHCQIVDGGHAETINTDWRLSPREALRFPVLAGILYQPVTSADSIAYYHNVIAEQIMGEIPSTSIVTPASLESPTKNALVSHGILPSNTTLSMTDNSLYLAMLSDAAHYDGADDSVLPHVSQLLPDYENYKTLSKTISRGIASTSTIVGLNAYITEVLTNIRSSNFDQDEIYNLEVLTCVTLASNRLWKLHTGNSFNAI